MNIFLLLSHISNIPVISIELQNFECPSYVSLVYQHSACTIL